MVTYCTVCRTGRVFSPIVEGQPETFRLVGMDHFNAMFEDEGTGFDFGAQGVLGLETADDSFTPDSFEPLEMSPAWSRQPSRRTIGDRE